MIRISTQLRVEKPYHSGAGVYLDINDGRCPKLSFNIESYARTWGRFDYRAAEFAYFCAVIYGCDRAIGRDSTLGDRWTREISVEIPVSDPVAWEVSVPVAEEMLEFLTGDIWHLSFISSSVALFGREFKRTKYKFRSKSRIQCKAVSLFSGGLDSLVGIIDWLEENPKDKLLLASTYDAQAESAKKDQERILPYLKAAYPNRVQRFVARSGLVSDGLDINFRSRSLTFLGNSVLAASFIGEGCEIRIPENGAIALNFPLTPARRGSLSTRTVHPNYLRLFNSFLSSLGFSSAVINPYEYLTKGEMMQDCLNKALLEDIYFKSVSCGKRGFSKMHWHDKHAQACGHCVPCIFRQAAVFSAGFASEKFGCNIRKRGEWGSSDLLKPNGDIQSVVDFVKTEHSSADIWRVLRANGYLHADDKGSYIDLVLRLKDELRAWLVDIKII